LQNPIADSRVPYVYDFHGGEMSDGVNSYQLSLVIHVLINRKGKGETIAMIKDETTFVGRGQTRGDAIHSVLKRWLGFKECDTFMRNGAIYLQNYETKSWVNDNRLPNDEIKLITVKLADQHVFIPAHWCEYFNFSKLGLQPGQATINLLTDAIEKLGTKSETIQGEIGIMCARLKEWAQANPNNQWQIR
jgi:hypothetical protein